jgi:outer membrane protein OmpA-like peptidoglycan-associated protein
MKTKFLLFFFICQNLLLAQNNISIYYEVGNENISISEKTKLNNFLKKIPVNSIQSFSLNIYHDDTGDHFTNAELSKKRADALKRFLISNNFDQYVIVNYKGEIKVNNDKLSPSELVKIRNNNRRIDLVVNARNTNESISKSPGRPIEASKNKTALNFTTINNKYIVYYKGDNEFPNTIDLDNLNQILLNLDTKKIHSITLHTYNHDSGNKTKTDLISKKRAEELKKNINKIQPHLNVNIVYKGDVKTPLKDGMSQQHIEYLINKNKRIEVVANYNTNTIAKNTLKANNNSKVDLNKAFNFSDKNNTYTIYYKGKNTISPDQNEINNLAQALKKIDTTKVKSITINVFNDDSGNKIADDNLSKKRAEGIEKELTKHTKLKSQTNYKGNLKTEIKDVYSDIHIEYLRNKNRRIDIVSNYPGQTNALDLTVLNLKYTFSPNNTVGDRIYIRNSNFQNDQSIITKELARELDIIALQLKKYSNIQIEIQGHICCTKGGYEALDKATGKVELSTNRAKSAYNYLIKKNIDPKRLRFKGYGNSKPLGLAEEHDKRIELMIIKT